MQCRHSYVTGREENQVDFKTDKRVSEKTVLCLLLIDDADRNLNSYTVCIHLLLYVNGFHSFVSSLTHTACDSHVENGVDVVKQNLVQLIASHLIMIIGLDSPNSAIPCQATA